MNSLGKIKPIGLNHPHLVRALVIIAVLATGSPRRASASDPKANHMRPFTIKDSIEISYIVNPSTWTVNHEAPVSPIISPDRRYFLLITQRGVLSNNTIESTIWLFDRKRVLDYLSTRSTVNPKPRRIAILRASANTAVISDVRWLADSKQIAFLGRSIGSMPQLFVADIIKQSLRRVTKSDEYVSAYDIAGDTIAYTTLTDPDQNRLPKSGLTDVTGQTMFSLLWPDKGFEDLAESHLVKVPNLLHIQKKGKEIPISFTFNGRPLRLFFPVLSLSPNGKSLITVAPVAAIPPEWEQYQPWSGRSELLLKPDNKWALADENAWKASEEVIVDLKTGRASTLIDAPAGRSLFFVSAPSKVIWSSDSRRALIANTFLPIVFEEDTSDKMKRSLAPAVAIVDLSSRKIQPITYLEQPLPGTTQTRRVSDIGWCASGNEVYLTYASNPDNVPLASYDTYELQSGRWRKTGTFPRDPCVHSSQEKAFYISENLNQPPILIGKQAATRDAVTLWDPNPQLAGIAMGKASLYQWHDQEGNLWSGILALPPDYDPLHRYPLVIQTHGFEPLKFFADGRYTTGSGGRALCAKGIVVLQMDQPGTYFGTARDGPFQVGGFESAIAHLDADGVIDPHSVGVIGFSFTCFHVLHALIHKPNLFAAASITDGNNVSYLQYLMWTDIPFAQQFAEKINGGIPFGEGLLQWAGTAPGFNSDKIKTPLLISALEKGALIGQWEIYAGLRRLKKPADMLWLRNENAPHVLVQPAQRLLSQQTAVDWFDFWLNGNEDADPAKASQYKRWRELRADAGARAKDQTIR